jgi:GTP-binding protein
VIRGFALHPGENESESAVPRHHKSVVPTKNDVGSVPLVAIVGRPNVGKSTLFNRLTKSRRSIVGDEPGITRDRIYGDYEWGGRQFRLVDTGGMVPDDAELIPTEIYAQAQVAIEEADAIIMVVDVRTELASPDYDLARMMLRSGKPLFLAVNKVEGEVMGYVAENFRELGIQNLYAISSEHALGIGDLLEAVSDALPAPEPVAGEEAVAEETAAVEYEPDSASDSGFDESEDFEDSEDREGFSPAGRAGLDREALSLTGRTIGTTHGEYEQHETSIAIIGRPNVGKSTLLNAITGTERAIVSPIAGTTRDAVDEVVEFEGQRLRFIDTAGIRRKGKTHLMAEKLSVVMARRHLEAADVALLIIDATEGVTGADANIGGYAHESGRSVIVVINKWDAVTHARTDGKPQADRMVYEEQVRRALKYLSYASVIFLSALEGSGVQRVLNEVKAVAAERRKRVTTGQMNRFLDKIDFQRAPVPMNKRLRIFYMTQAAVAPPTFVLFTDRDIELHFSFQRFLENQIREAFGFKGTPIWFKVVPRNKKKDE